MSSAPAQIDDLELVEVADGFVVYHPERERVHFLNTTAAVVLSLCDGQLDATEIAQKLERLYELPEPPQEEVSSCLASLQAEDLVR